jgi:hypothetical protein
MGQGRPESKAWTKSKSGHAQSKTFQRLGNDTDRMYSLDTINLVGDEERQHYGAFKLDFPQKVTLRSEL